MYRQILLREEDRHHQHIFYRPNQDSPILEFQLNTVTHGLTPSAYLAQRTLLQLVEDKGFRFPLGSRTIRHHTYVDVISWAPSLSKAPEWIKQLIELFARSGFELRKWSSNLPELIADFPQDHLENPMPFSDDSSTIKMASMNSQFRCLLA